MTPSEVGERPTTLENCNCAVCRASVEVTSKSNAVPPGFDVLGKRAAFEESRRLHREAHFISRDEIARREGEGA